MSDVDLAVEVLPKIADRERLATKNRRRVETLLDAGHVFRNILEVHFYWYREVFTFFEESEPRDLVGSVDGSDKQGNNRDTFVAAAGLLLQGAVRYQGGIRDRNKGKSEPDREGIPATIVVR